MSKNIVSILCPSYNHEKYVGFFIESLLNQTNPNWELIIVDDCSTDNNIAEIKKYNDKRIKLIQNSFNMGINCGLNRAFTESQGRYISFCASDDMLKPDYVEKVFKCFSQHPDKEIVYCNLQIINDDNNYTGKVYLNPQTDRYDVLKHMFFIGNWPLSPGMTVKRELFESLLPLDIPMSQYQDYKMHIDLLLRADFVVMSGFSVLYRKADEHTSGISAYNEKTTKSRHLEENILMNSFIKIQDVSLLKKIFVGELKEYKTISEETIPFVLGMLALKSQETYKKIWGYNQVAKFINDPEHYAQVHKMYGFSYKDYLNLVTNFENDPIETKYRKYKRLFNKLLVVIATLILTIIGILVI